MPRVSLLIYICASRGFLLSEHRLSNVNADAGKNIKSDLEQGMQDINAKTRSSADTNFDKAATKGQACTSSRFCVFDMIVYLHA